MTKPTRLDPRWYAAPLLAAVAVAGAFSGSAIGSTPMLSNAASTLPESPPPARGGASAPAVAASLPDHYPLVTPDGTIPVAELARHGRLRHAYADWDAPYDYAALAEGSDGQLSEAEIDRLAAWRPEPRAAAIAEPEPRHALVSVARGAGPVEATRVALSAPAAPAAAGPGAIRAQAPQLAASETRSPGAR